MSNKSSLRFIAALLFAASVCATLAIAGIGIRAQNTNSSTTTGESAQDANVNANTNTTRRGRGRGRRGANTNANTGDATTTGDNANTGDATTTGDNANAGAVTGGDTTQEEETVRDLSGERFDLSGSYTGRVTMTGAHEMSGEATLTITGNQFTLTSEGMTHNGRVYAVITRGYVGAAFYFADMTDPATNTPVVANVRARKSGERLTLTPVTPTRTRMTFTPAGGGRRGRTGRGATPTPDANSNTGDNSNTTPPM